MIKAPEISMSVAISIIGDTKKELAAVVRKLRKHLEEL